MNEDKILGARVLITYDPQYDSWKVFPHKWWHKIFKPHFDYIGYGRTREAAIRDARSKLTIMARVNAKEETYI